MKAAQAALVCGLCVALLWTTGCISQRPPTTDIDSATSLIQSTLDAWKKGVDLSELRKRSPPIYVSDEMWMQGAMLKDYSIEESGEQFGTNVRFVVTLHAIAQDGSSLQRKVKYLVATAPARSVAREDR